MTNKQFNIRKKFLEEWFDFNPVMFFILICILSFVIVFLKKSFLIDQMAAFEVLEERGEMGIFNLFYSLQYLVVPIFFGWKLTLTSFLLWVGCFMYGYRVTFKELWKLALLLELWFFIPEILKILYFLFIETDPNYWDVRAFYPISLINLFEYEQLSAKWHYVLKALNVFEITYWFFLVYGIYFISGKKLSYSYAIVFSSYVFFFLIWLVYYLLSYR